MYLYLLLLMNNKYNLKNEKEIILNFKTKIFDYY
jgi:hypothetical protein